MHAAHIIKPQCMTPTQQKIEISNKWMNSQRSPSRSWSQITRITTRIKPKPNLNAGREHISWCQPSNTENLSSPSTNSWKKISENDLHGKRSARTRKTMKLIECMKRGGERRKERRFYPKKRNDYEMGLSWKATGRGGMGEKRK